MTNATLTLVASHRNLLANAAMLLRRCDAIVEFEGKGAFDISNCDAAVKADTALNTRLLNEWNAFVKTLTEAVGRYQQDVVHKHGFDEKNHVGSYCRNVASGAFTRLRQNAREHLIAQLEA